LKKIIVIIGLVLSLTLISATDFEILELQEDYLIVKFSLPEYEFVSVTTDGKEQFRLFCEGAAYTNEYQKTVLPFFAESIGLPINGDFNITVLDRKQSTKKVQTLLVSSEGDPKTNRKDKSIQYPKSIVSKGDSAYLGDRYFCGFSVFPFQYSQKKGELRITSELTFRIDITGNTRSRKNYIPDANFIDKVGDSFFLNNRFSKNWRKEKEKTATTTSNLRSSEFVNQIQLIVDEEGIYKVSYELLEQTLSDPDYPINFEMEFDWDEIDPHYLELSDENGVIPINFIGELDGSFDPGDYFEFYGNRHAGEERYSDDYTAENVYTLSLTDHYGCRMAVENGGLTNVGQGNVFTPTSFQQTVHFEQQNIRDHLTAQYTYDSSDYYREDIWFWASVRAPGLKVFPFELEYPKATNIKNFWASVTLFGQTYNKYNYTELNHYAIVNLNTAMIGQREWYGQTEVTIANDDDPLSNNDLNHGTNNLYINLPGLPDIPLEQILLDYFEVVYWREYKTDTDYLKFAKPQDMGAGIFQFELENFSTENVSVYKIGKSIIENLQITVDEELENSPYKITFQDSISYNSTEFIAVSEEMKKNPKRIIPDIPANLKDPFNAAEYVIITTQEYSQKDAVIQLKEFWEGKGFVTQVIALQDILDDFNHGIRSAEAIRDFLHFAYNNWTEPQLSHVMLLGDGLTDELDDSVNREFNLIPFRHVWVEFRGAIASDNWLACIVGNDPVADLSLSRFSVWQENQLDIALEKTVSYMETPNHEDFWHSSVTFAAGGNPSDTTFFAHQSENIIRDYIPEEFNAKRVYCNILNMPEEYFGNTTSLISNINDGTLYVQFIGHGGGYVWADYNLLNKADIQTFNNENLPIFASMSCYGSAFNFPRSSCIGEELILAPGKGGIAHIGFTGFGYKYADEYFAGNINRAMFEMGITNIGEIAEYTKAKFYSTYGNSDIGIALIHGCALLGDPRIDIYLPEKKEEIVLNEYNVAPGDTLQISAFVGDDITHGKFMIFDENDAELPLNLYYPFTVQNENNYLNMEYIVPDGLGDIYTNSIKLFGWNTEEEVTGISHFSIGQSAMSNLQIAPESPTEDDEIMISADFFDEDGIDHIEFKNISESIIINMQNTSGNHYELESAIPSHSAGSHIDFQFLIYDSIGDTTITEQRKIIISAPNLWMQEIEFCQQNNQPALKVYLTNIGMTTGGTCNLKLYDLMNNNELLVSQQIDQIDVMEERIEIITLPILNREIQIKAIVNENGESFGEISLSNNSKNSDPFQFNLFLVGNSSVTGTSLDGNFECTFPSGFLQSESIFYINESNFYQPINQPDVTTICLADSSFSRCYEIDTLNPDLLADSLGYFPNNEELSLKVYYSDADTLTQNLELAGNFAFYRWEENFDKWIYQGGTVNVENDFVQVAIDRTGFYTILDNQDASKPFVETNIQGQEFTQTIASLQNEDLIQTGYISKDGIISFLLNDENGIDVSDKKISLNLNSGGIPVDISSDNFSISAQFGQLGEVPVKYQLDDLEKGSYELRLKCFDVNGNEKIQDIEFDVNAKFDVLNFANYPNPVSSRTIYPQNKGRTRFTYVLTDEADKVNIKVYTVSGRLVQTFKDLPTTVGYHEFPRIDVGWDCRDSNGKILANGVYFYRITACKGSKKIEKIEKMAILR
jgi:Peptidase family C25/FlgD Ig-like domain/Propeptide_C25